MIMALLAFGIFYVVESTLRQAQNAIQPVTNITSNLGTQVSEVLHPTPTVLPDPVTVIQEVRSMARLETIQYTVEKVITAETGQGTFGFLFGDKLLFVAHGIVIAGVDMQKLTPEDLQVKDGVLYVRLPAPEVFIATLDNSKSYVYNRDTGVLSRGDVNLETAARRVAEAEIAKAALEDGILTMASQNAQNYLYSLFINLGFPEVIFVNPQTAPTPVIPALTPTP